MTTVTACDPRSAHAIRIEATNAALTRAWWAFALRGMAAILFGLSALFLPAHALESLVFVFALYMLLDCAFAVLTAARQASGGERWTLLMIEAIVDLAVAGAALFLPGLDTLGLALLVAGRGVIIGACSLVGAFALQMNHGRVWMAFAGSASFMMGLLTFAAPLFGGRVLAWWLGLYALVFGASLLVLAVSLKACRPEHKDGAVGYETV
jgi:uncharacterized membrane protein HdeD (DUF308 family)